MYILGVDARLLAKGDWPAVHGRSMLCKDVKVSGRMSRADMHGNAGVAWQCMCVGGFLGQRCMEIHQCMP